MLLNAAGLRSVSQDLRTSAGAVGESGRAVVAAASGFAAADVGKAYAAQGDRVAAALTGVGTHLYGWTNCVTDLCDVLDQAVTGVSGADAATAAALQAQRAVLA